MELKEKVFNCTTQKQLFAKLKQLERKLKRIKLNDRSSKEERKVNALALRAEEGRDNLR